MVFANPRRFCLLSDGRFVPWCLMLAFSSTLWSQETAPDLVWKLKPNDQFQVVSQQQETTETTVDSRKVTVESDVQLEFNWKITDVGDEGEATIEQSLTRVKVIVENPAEPAQAVEYDTDSERKITRTSAKLMKQVKPLLGLKFIVFLDRNGKIEKVEMPEATEEELNKLPESLGLKQLLGSDSIGGLLSLMPVDSAERSKSSWTTEVPLSTGMGEHVQQTTYSVEDGNSEGQVKIRVESRLQDLPTESPTARSASTGSGDQPGKLTSFSGQGEMQFDTTDGFLRSSSMSWQMASERTYREKTIITEHQKQTRLTFEKR